MTTVEVVGGFLFNLDEARDSHTAIAALDLDSLITKRYEVTEELEWICDRAFTPRFAQATIDGSGERELSLPSNDHGSSHDIRTVTAVTVDGTAYSDDQISGLFVYGTKLAQPDGSVWAVGQQNVTVSWTYGLDAPAPRLKGASLDRLRILVNRPKSGIPDRATQLTITEVGTMQLATASRYKTGYPDIDAVYERWSNRALDGQAAPAYGSIDFNPQHGSLFHGGRR